MNKVEILNKYIFYPNDIHWEYEISSGVWQKFNTTTQYFIDNSYMRKLNVCEMYINDVYYFLLFDKNSVIILDEKTSNKYNIRRIDVKNRRYERGTKNIFKEK